MAWEFVNAFNSGTPVGGVGTISIEETFELVQDAVVFVFTSNYTSGGVEVDRMQDTAGNTYQRLGSVAGSDGSHRVELWYAIVETPHAASFLDVIFDTNTQFGYVFMSQYSGLDIADLIATIGDWITTPSSINQSTDTIAAPAGALLLSFWITLLNGNRELAWDNNEESRVPINSGVFMAERRIADAGNYACEATLSDVDIFYNGVFAFNALADEPEPSSPGGNMSFQGTLSHTRMQSRQPVTLR